MSFGFDSTLCLQVSAGAGGAGGQQGGPRGRAGSVPQRGPGAGRGLGLPLHGDVGQEQDDGGRAFRRDRQADGLLPSARPKRDMLPPLQRTVAAQQKSERKCIHVEELGGKQNSLSLFLPAFCTNKAHSLGKRRID